MLTSYVMSSEKCRLRWKMRYYHTTVSMAKLQNTDNIKCCWGWGTIELSYSSLVGMQNGTATLKDSLSVSYKTEYTSTMWFSNHTPWYLLQRSSKFVSKQKTAHGCCSIFIHNSQNLEATKVSFSRKMDNI